MKTAIAIVALVLSATTVHAAEEAALSVFAKSVSGIWSAMPIGPIMAFDGAAIASALARCSDPTAGLVRYLPAKEGLFRLEPDRTSAILDAHPTGSRNGFTAWAVATNTGLQVVLLGQMGQAENPVDILIADEASYVRCPVRSRKPKP